MAVPPLACRQDVVTTTTFRLHLPTPLNEGVCSRLGRLVWNFMADLFPGLDDRLFGTVERENLPFRVVKPGGHQGYVALEVDLSCECDANCRESLLEGLANIVRESTGTPVEAILIRLTSSEGTWWAQGDGKPYFSTR
ncbi:MAG: hypothetical protein ACTSU5_00920 [Promethearchaeota archaeon]